MTWQDILLKILYFIVVTVGGYVLKEYVLPYVKEHRLTEVARVLVNAAEALYGAGHGKEKLEYCIQQINEKYHLHVDPEKVTNAIQAAWQELDIAQKSVKAAE